MVLFLSMYQIYNSMYKNIICRFTAWCVIDAKEIGLLKVQMLHILKNVINRIMEWFFAEKRQHAREKL